MTHNTENDEIDSDILDDAARFDAERASKPVRAGVPAPIAVSYRWEPEGDGYTLYRYTGDVRGRNCGRLNTDAVGSTHQLAELYNRAAAATESDLAETMEAQGHRAEVEIAKLRQENEALQGIAGAACRRVTEREQVNQELRKVLKLLAGVCNAYDNGQKLPTAIVTAKDAALVWLGER